MNTVPLTYHSWLRQCHPHSPSLHHRGRTQEGSGFCCHMGVCTPLRASCSWSHLNGPDTEVCRRIQASCLYTSCHERIGIGLEGWIIEICKRQYNWPNWQWIHCIFTAKHTFFTFTLTVPLIRSIFAIFLSITHVAVQNTLFPIPTRFGSQGTFQRKWSTCNHTSVWNKEKKDYLTKLSGKGHPNMTILSSYSCSRHMTFYCRYSINND